MGHRDDLLVTRQYTRMTNAAGGPPTRSVCLLGFVQVPIWEVWHAARTAEFECHRIAGGLGFDLSERFGFHFHSPFVIQPLNKTRARPPTPPPPPPPPPARPPPL